MHGEIGGPKGSGSGGVSARSRERQGWASDDSSVRVEMGDHRSRGRTGRSIQGPGSADGAATGLPVAHGPEPVIRLIRRAQRHCLRTPTHSQGPRRSHGPLNRQRRTPRTPETLGGCGRMPTAAAVTRLAQKAGFSFPRKRAGVRVRASRVPFRRCAAPPVRQRDEPWARETASSSHN